METVSAAPSEPIPEVDIVMTRSAYVLMPALLLIGAAAAAATLEEGVKQYRHGHYAEAETTLRQVCEANPEDAAALENLSLTLASLKKTEEADATLSKAADQGLESDRVKAAQARIAIERRDLETASTLVEEALEANAENANALHSRGMVRVARKDFAGAAEDFEKAIELQPDVPYSHYYAGIAYNGIKRADKMVEHLQQFLRLAPDAPESDKVRSLLRAFR